MTQPNHCTLAREVLTLAWPAVLQGLVTTVVLFTDRLILGRWDADALAAMGLATPLVWSIFSVFLAFAAGVVAVIGRAVGRRDFATARRTVRASVGLAAGLGVIIALLGAPLGGVISRGLAGPATAQHIVDWSASYLWIALACAPLALVAAAASAALQAAGDTRTPMWAGLWAGMLNLGISWVLVFGLGPLPELGVTGAAIGTAVAMAAHAGWVLWALRQGRKGLAFGQRAPDDPPVRDTLRPVLRVSGPAFAEKAIYHAAYLGFTALIGHLGGTALAAHQALIAIESVSFIAAGGFGVSAGALVAQKLGADRPDDAAAAGWLSTWMGAAALSVVAVVFLVAAEPLVAIFTTDPEVIRLGATCLRVAAIAQPLMAITDALAGALRGAGDTTTPMRAAIAGPVLVRLSACWLFAYPLGFGLVGIWIGSTLDWMVRSVWLGLAFRRGRWRDLEVD